MNTNIPDTELKNSISLKKVLLGGLIFLSSSQLMGQSLTGADSTKNYRVRDFRTWSIGVTAGVATPHTLFWSNKNNDYTTPTESFGYGVYIKKQLIPSFGLQADFFAGKVRGIDAISPSGTLPDSRYSTRIKNGGSLTATYTIANFKMHKEFGLLGPYLNSGIGFMSFDPTSENSGNTTDGTKDGFYIPVGLGFKIGLTRGINLDMGYKVSFMKTDRFDGYDYGTSYDRFTYGYAGLEFAIGKRSKYQLAAYNPGGRSAEYDDTELRRAVARLDSLQKEDRARYDRELGDEDNDGVANKFDKCPGTPAGVKVDGSGCPLPEFAQKVLKDAFNNLEFEFGKSRILPSSYPTLDKLAQLIVDHGFSLKISGHTDNIGSDKFNLKLSKDRAEAVKTYLVGKGATVSNIEATGYGEFQPITTNDTPEGRKQNRRVEFTLY
ncbi:OmpA family protein [Desertivirga xinjiangensis]|uniref:OmpA family protein n=1 Tax=Desertivirga xinjiangensis TaxID=539206 RepID=UPI00210B2193|nr:OmpA family protein [Pedobacter xinjiangensis]